MGNSLTVDQIIGPDILEEYAELTYLTKSDIRRIFRLVDDVDPGRLRKNLQHRFTKEQVEKVLPQIRHNPFRNSIYRVFSSQNDDHLSFEDILDLCSAFSENCPLNVRAAWAFNIFDFDSDKQVTLNDLIEAVQRLTGFYQDGRTGINTQDAERIARAVLKEIDISRMGSISSHEFVYFVERIPDFAHTFCFKF